MVLPQNSESTDSTDWLFRSGALAARMKGNQLCPACGKQGKRVGRVTLKALLTCEQQPRIGTGQYRFCGEPSCQIVYYAEDSPSLFPKTALTVRVGVKESDSPRTICYCFDHTLEEIDDEVRRTGTSTVLDDIKGQMKTACWCETKNPQGSCCLGTVTRAIDESQKRYGHKPDQEPKAAGVVLEECCPTESPAVPVPDLAGIASRSSSKSGGSWRPEYTFPIGAILSAVAASVCCWLPLTLATLGVSGAGLFAALEPYRPISLAATFGLLGAAFYFSYRPRFARGKEWGVSASAGDVDESSPGAGKDCCPGVALSHSERSSRPMLWAMALIALAFAFFPNYADFLLGSRDTSAYSAGIQMDSGAVCTLVIEGMTCEGCAAQVQLELSKVQGVRGVDVHYSEGKALVVTEAAVADMSLIEAVERVGYRVRETPLRTGRSFSSQGEMKH